MNSPIALSTYGMANLAAAGEEWMCLWSSFGLKFAKLLCNVDEPLYQVRQRRQIANYFATLGRKFSRDLITKVGAGANSLALKAK